MPFIAPNTRTKSPQRRLQEGQAIILIALLILVLFGMLGLAIDSGRGYVDRRDQQAAVDAAALAAGDWYENYSELNLSINNSVNLYQRDLRLYNGYTSVNHAFALVGVNNNLPQDTYTYTYNEGYTLTIVATNTQFNGYQFVFTTDHNLPLAFMQIFGGGLTIPTGATATSIVGNQRQTPALLTLSTQKCSMNLTGSAQLTVLGDVYSNGQACLDSNLHEAGNCYGAAGSNCSDAQYYCYNSTPGFVPYPPPCAAGDTIGTGIVPAPTLPDPGYLATQVAYYQTLQSYNQWNRGTWTEMYPGVYGTFHLSGGSASCAFLDPGVYTWSNGYSSDANGSLLSNEMRPPEEELWSAPGTTSVANPQFWDQNGVGVGGAAGAGCSGLFTVSATPAPGFGIKHQGGGGQWGVEVTSVRYDQEQYDASVSPNPCAAAPGCRRESAPSECQQVSTLDGNNQGINVNITRNAPGAQYYNVYVNPNGCDGVPNNFSFVGRYNAPGWIGAPPAIAVGPWPNGVAVVLVQGVNGWPCGLPTVTICGITYNNMSPTAQCYAQVRTQLCQTPDDEGAPQCFANCPPPANLLSQENAPMSLEYPPYSAGDVSNENFCQPSPNPGSINAPCLGSEVTPGGVQFYFPAGSCFNQNSGGATYVYAGVQYNWIVIYAPTTNSCSESLNGGASTQYIGTIYTPSANWTINGGDRSPLAGQVICYTATVAGGGQAGIDFNPNYSPVPPAARLIN
jgi:Flp pilus assembly protein TadG